MTSTAAAATKPIFTPRGRVLTHPIIARRRRGLHTQIYGRGRKPIRRVQRRDRGGQERLEQERIMDTIPRRHVRRETTVQHAAAEEVPAVLSRGKRRIPQRAL